MQPRLETVLERAFCTILKLQEGPCTVKELGGTLGVVHSCAWKYMQAASVTLPVVALNEETRKGNEPVVYSLMEN